MHICVQYLYFSVISGFAEEFWSIVVKMTSEKSLLYVLTLNVN